MRRTIIVESRFSNTATRYLVLIKVALRFSGVNFVSLNFIDYVSMALCMGDNRVGDTSDLLDLPQEMGLARRGSF